MTAKAIVRISIHQTTESKLTVTHTDNAGACWSDISDGAGQVVTIFFRSAEERDEFWFNASA